ncbi:MAG: M14 family zinc carboxypeptidase [Anaerolineae bacterium]|jgi:hypothetical protein
MPEAGSNNERGSPAAITVLLVVLAVFATFGVGLGLGGMWEGSLPAPTASSSPPELEPTTSPVEPTVVPSPTATEPTPPTATRVAVEATEVPSPPPPSPTPLAVAEGPFVFGRSFNGNDLLAYRIGRGSSARALIGGIHGGYEWNTTVLVEEILSTLQHDPHLVPLEVTLYVIPCANPDGAAAGTDAVHGRVNGNNVDLNRNWDYEHQPVATHGTRPVSGGEQPFSELETQALRDFIFERDIELAIFYHSAMGRVFSGFERENCATYELAEMMSEATGYPHSPDGVYGQVTTGDAIDYLSKVGIAAIEIELTNHRDIDWDQNWRGVTAFLEWDIPTMQHPSDSERRYEDGPAASEFFYHTVQPGQTLSYLSLEYGVEEAEIIGANVGIDDPDQIRVGQLILIPRRPSE